MQSRLRLLYYNHTAEVSGAEISLLTALVQLRRQAEVALAAPEGELLTRARALDIPVYILPGYSARMTTHPLRLLSGVWEMYRCSRHLKALLRAIRPDILHANSIRAGLIAAAAVRAQSVGVVWHVRDNLETNLVGRVIRRIAEARADTVVAISEAVAAHFATRPRLRHKTRVVYNGVDVDPLTCASSLRAELGLSKDTFVAAVVGQITPWKRQHDAIAAFRRIAFACPNSELWIVGAAKFRVENQQYEEWLRRQAAAAGLVERVRFLGFQADIQRVMDAIDVLLVPSDHEPFGRVIIEAMLAGKPVIGTAGGGIPEIIVDGETGYLVPVGNVDGFTERMLTLQGAPALRTRLGAAGRQRVLERFTSVQSARGLVQVYEALKHPFEVQAGVSG